MRSPARLAPSLRGASADRCRRASRPVRQAGNEAARLSHLRPRICPGRLPPALRGAFAWRIARATPSAMRAGGRAARPHGLRRAARTGRSCCLRRNQPARPGPLPCCASGARTHPQFLWISRRSSVAILWCVWGMGACCRNRQCCGAAAHAVTRHRAAPGSASLRPLRGADGPCVSLPPSAASGLRAPLAGHWS